METFCFIGAICGICAFIYALIVDLRVDKLEEEFRSYKVLAFETVESVRSALDEFKESQNERNKGFASRKWMDMQISNLNYDRNTLFQRLDQLENRKFALVETEKSDTGYWEYHEEDVRQPDEEEEDAEESAKPRKAADQRSADCVDLNPVVESQGD